MKKTLIIFSVVLSMFWTACAFAELKEGLWEITTQVEMKGMPQSLPPTTMRQCITKNDAVPKNKDKNYDCKTISQKVSGNTVSYTVECKGKEGVMQTSGTTTYADTFMNGSSTTSFKMKGQPEMTMANKMKGKYVGTCPK
jgi:hypothetical protein